MRDKVTADDLCAQLSSLCLELLAFSQRSPHLGSVERGMAVARYTDEYLTLREQVGLVLRNGKAPDSLGEQAGG